MSISRKVERAVWVTHGGRCAICRCPLFETGVHPTFLGEVAHIVAEKPNGPRGNIELSSDLSDDQRNLMLLCANHHTEIDKLVERYSVEYLLKLKSDHEAWVVRSLTIAPVWTPGKIMAGYMHIPRISVLASQAGMPIDWPPLLNEKGLHSLGFEIGSLMVSVSRVMEAMRPHALEFDSMASLDSEYVGTLISIKNILFRTKNCHFSDEVKYSSTESDWNAAPHIYHKSKFGFNFVLGIDPRWITTSSAFTWFGGGQWRFSGLIFVNNIDHESGIIFATPLFIGTESAF